MGHGREVPCSWPLAGVQKSLLWSQLLGSAQQLYEAADYCKESLAEDSAALCVKIRLIFIFLYLTFLKVEGREGESSCFESQ